MVLQPWGVKFKEGAVMVMKSKIRGLMLIVILGLSGVSIGMPIFTSISLEELQTYDLQALQNLDQRIGRLITQVQQDLQDDSENVDVQVDLQTLQANQQIIQARIQELQP